MAKRKLATLEVWVDEDDREGSSFLNANRESNEYVITIRPNGVDKLNTIKRLQTTLAHELGHFAAHVLRDESHDPFLLSMAQFINSGLLPAEKKANEIAGQMGLELDKGQLQEAIDTYKAA